MRAPLSCSNAPACPASRLSSTGGAGVDVGAGVEVGRGVGAVVGAGVEAGAGAAVGSGVEVGAGIGAGSGVNVGAGASAVRGAGMGVNVGSGVGVDVGSGVGVDVGSGVGVDVGRGVDVALGSAVGIHTFDLDALESSQAAASSMTARAAMPIVTVLPNADALFTGSAPLSYRHEDLSVHDRRFSLMVLTLPACAKSALATRRDDVLRSAPEFP